MDDASAHWEHVYTTKKETAVSWYQVQPARSLDFIAANAERDAPIVDIGGGASTLVDHLLEAGFSDLTVLDISSSALAKSQDRLESRAARVSWIVADITHWQPPRRYRVWHDRAVFHFLTGTAEQDAYIAALRAGTESDALIVMATFALDGPEQCSGLPVQRYSPQTLACRLGASFTPIAQARESHPTPWGSTQQFSYAVFRRQAAS